MTTTIAPRLAAGLRSELKALADLRATLDSLDMQEPLEDESKRWRDWNRQMNLLIHEEVETERRVMQRVLEIGKPPPCGIWVDDRLVVVVVECDGYTHHLGIIEPAQIITV
jgi:hypothetical protein